MLKFVIENKVHPSIRPDLTRLNYVLKAVGLIPLNLKLRVSFPNYLYSVLLLCILISLSVRGIIKIYASMYTHNSVITLVTAHFQLLGVTVASWVILVCAALRFRVYESAFEKLIQIEDVLFNKIDAETPKHGRIIKHLVRAIIFIFAAIFVDCCVILQSGPKCYRRYMIAFHSAFIYIILSDGHAITIFELIKIRFQQVNDYFTNALRPNKTMDITSLFIIPQYSLTKMRIKELSRIHCDLIGITSEFNSYFSPMLLLEIAVFFIISTCNAYNFFHVLTTRKPVEFNKPIAIHSICWTIVVLLKLIFLLKSSVSITKQVVLFVASQLSYLFSVLRLAITYKL